MRGLGAPTAPTIGMKSDPSLRLPAACRLGMTGEKCGPGKPAPEEAGKDAGATIRGGRALR